MLKRLLSVASQKDIDELRSRFNTLEDQVDEMGERQDAIQNELEAIHDSLEDKVEDDDLRERIQDVVEELEFLQEKTEDEDQDFSSSEKQILRVLINTDGFIGAGDIADQLGKSDGTVRKYMSMLRDKIELSTRKDGRKTLYRLPTHVQDEFLEGSRSITLTE